MTDRGMISAGVIRVIVLSESSVTPDPLASKNLTCHYFPQQIIPSLLWFDKIDDPPPFLQVVVPKVCLDSRFEIYEFNFIYFYVIYDNRLNFQ